LPVGGAHEGRAAQAAARGASFRSCNLVPENTMKSLLAIAAATGLALAAGSIAAQPAAPESRESITGRQTGPGVITAPERPRMAGSGRRTAPGVITGPENTPGWPMMSAQEQREHRNRMRSFRTYQECAAYRDQHRNEMAARAAERRLGAPPAPRRDVCAGLPR
jgi:hypothetical protein